MFLSQLAGHKVVLTPIDDFKARYDLTHQCYLPTRNTDKSYELALSKIGKEHDKGAVFGILLRSNLEDPDKVVLQRVCGVLHRVFQVGANVAYNAGMPMADKL